MKSYCLIGDKLTAKSAKSLGSALTCVLGNKIGFCGDNSDFALFAVRNIAGGVKHCGGCAINFGVGFEAQAGFFVRHFGLDSLVFVSGGSSPFVSVYGADGRALDHEKEDEISRIAASGDFPCKRGGVVTEVDGGAAYYRQLICENESFENVSAAVHSRNALIKGCVNRVLVSLNGSVGGKTELFISPSGFNFSAVDENGKHYTNDKLQALLAYYHLLDGKSLTVPFSAPSLLDAAAEKGGAKVKRSFYGGEELWQTDSVFACTVLFSLMHRHGCGLASLASSIPQNFAKRTTVKSDCDLTSISDLLPCDDIVTDFNGGIFAKLKGGNLLIVPNCARGSFCIEVQAPNEEIAEEIIADTRDSLCLTSNGN